MRDSELLILLGAILLVFFILANLPNIVSGIFTLTVVGVALFLLYKAFA